MLISPSIKTWYNGLKNVERVIFNIRNVSAVIDAGTNLLNTTSLTALSASIKGLSVDQAMLALSTKNLTKEQMEQVLVEAGLLASNKNIKAELIQRAFAESALNKEKQIAILKGLNLLASDGATVISTKACAKAKLEEKLAIHEVVGADAEAIISSLGLTSANAGQTVSYNVLTKSIWANVKAMGAWLITNPFGLIITIGAAIWGITKAYDALTVSLEELAEKAQKSQDTYNSLTSEIESINSELKTTGQRIDELNGKENLSLIEQDELNKLKETNSELQLELELKQRLADVANKEASDDAKAYFNKSSKYGYDNGSELVSVKGNQIDAEILKIQHYQVLQKEIQHTKAKMDSIIKSDPENYIKDSGYQGLKNTYDGLIYQSDELEKTISQNVSTFMELDNSLSNTDDESKQLLESLSLVYDKYSKVFKGIGENKNTRIDELFSRPTLQSAKEILVELGKQGSLSIDILQNSVSELKEGLEKAGISAEDLFEYIMALANPDAINISNVTKSLFDQFVKPNEGTDDWDFNSITKEFDDWITNKSDEELVIIYNIKKDNDTTGWSFEDFDKEVENRQNTKLSMDVSFSDSLSSLPMDKLEEYISLLDSGDINEKTISDYSYLAALIEQTGLSAEEALKAMKDFSEGFTLSSDLISSIQDGYDLLEKAKENIIDLGVISLNTLESIITKYPQLQDEVTAYTQGLISTEDVIYALQTAYNDDVDAFRSAMSAKLQGNEVFFNTIRENNESLFIALSNAYGDDIANWKTLAQAKAEIDKSLISQLASMWGKYYGSFDANVIKGKDGQYSLVSDDPTAIYESGYQEIEKAIAERNKMVRGLNEAANVEITIPDFGGIGGNKSGSGSKGSKGSKSKEPTEFDWMEQKITLLDTQVDKLKNNIESLVGYKNKNSVTNTAIDVLIEKTSVLQQMHDKYMEEAGKLGLSQNYVDKIQIGTIEIESIGDENLAKTIKEYQDLFEKAESANDQIIETQKSIKELSLSKLDNVIDQFSQLVDIQSQMIDTEKQLLDLREKSGEEIYADDYISLAEKQLNLTQQNADAYHTLATEMAQLNLQEGTEEWKKYNDQLQEYKKDMISAAEAVEEYKDAMTELAYKGLNDFKNSMDSINGAISTMNDLIGDSKLIDDFGSLTDRGMTQVALYAHQMTNAKQEAAEYAEAVKSLDDALDSGLITQDEYNSMLQEYTSSQESAVKSSKQARDAILSLVKEGIQAEIDAKKKLIDETKAALDAEKDLHDYQNSIAEKQDNISKLERQIAALSNSTNRDDIAQRLQLQSQLADAKKELYETQYDHEIEERKNALDKEYENFEESKQKESDELDSNLDAQNTAISKYLDQVKNNYSTVYGVLTQYGDEYSLSAIEDLTTPWESGSEAANLCSDAIGEAVANIQYEINGLDFSPLYELVDLLNQIGIDEYGNSSAGYEDITNTGKWQKGQGGKWWFGEDYNPNGDYDYASSGIYTIKGKQYGFDDNGYMITGWNNAFDDWRYFEPENGEMVKSQWRKDSKGEWYYLDKDGIMATNMAVKVKEGDGYYYLNDDGRWDGQDLTSEEVRKLRYPIGYKKGTHNASKGLHLMDEEGVGSEAVITDKGVMRKFEGGEVVFNPKMTDNLWNFAQDPTKFVSGLSNLNFHRLDFNKIQPIRNVTIDSPLVQIDGTGLSANEVATIIKNETRDIDKRVAKSIRYELMGK